MINKILDRSLEEIKEGFVYDKEKALFECSICGEIFEEGEIFTFDNRLFEASRAIKEHIKKEHGSVLESLLDIDKKYTGLTQKQSSLLRDMADGLSDKEIALKNGIAAATVRHQKFTFREKVKQAKIYLAIHESVEDASSFNSKDSLVKAHPGATMVDERYILTLEEDEKIIKNYFEAGDTLKLKILPSKEKKKIAVLREITKQFDQAKVYSEKELNEILKTIYDDISSIRRYLIQYGFLERRKDGSQYWIKK